MKFLVKDKNFGSVIFKFALRSLALRMLTIDFRVGQKRCQEFLKENSHRFSNITKYQQGTLTHEGILFRSENHNSV